MSRIPGDDVAAALCEAAHRDIDCDGWWPMNEDPPEDAPRSSRADG